jgi:hypothetical protein
MIICMLQPKLERDKITNAFLRVGDGVRTWGLGNVAFGAGS